jgi:hypothetical protein
LAEAAQALSGVRDDLRVGVVTKPELVLKYKERYGPRFFDEFSKNSIVLVREPETFIYYDLEKDDMDLKQWINKMSLKKTGDDINRETLAIAKSLGQPIVYLYIDRKSSSFKYNSKIALDSFQRLAPFWFDRFTFLLVEEGIASKDYSSKKSE